MFTKVLNIMLMVRFYTTIFLLAIVTACDMNQMDMDTMSMSGQSNNKKYSTNGETIFRTGRNLSGRIMQDLEKSQMSMMVHSCVSCHGSEGKGMMNTPSITYKDLTDPTKHDIPYTDSLIIQFLDLEIKSDGSVANTGVAFKMSEKDKQDLLYFLKTL